MLACTGTGWLPAGPCGPEQASRGRLPCCTGTGRPPGPSSQSWPRQTWGKCCTHNGHANMQRPLPVPTQGHMNPRACKFKGAQITNSRVCKFRGVFTNSRVHGLRACEYHELKIKHANCEHVDSRACKPNCSRVCKFKGVQITGMQIQKTPWATQIRSTSS